ncbi:MAG: hypothetical protein WCG73_00445 [Candidatus Moraniibacteriota bacterium]
MKKFLPIAFIVVALIFVGFYIRSNKNIPQAPEKQGEASVSGKTENNLASSETTPLSEVSDAVTSLKDAMGLGKRMKCSYSTTDGQGKSVSSSVVVDGDKYKFTADADGGKSYVIFDGETEYIWSSSMENRGLKMSRACIDEISALGGANKNILPLDRTPQGFEKAFGQTTGVTCEPTSEDFLPPANTNFIDQCEMMRNSLKAVEDLKGQLPAEVSVPQQ